MQEILVLIVVALAIFALPRMMGKRPEPQPMRVVRRPALTGRMRLAILLTLFWILGAAALLEPWQGDDVQPFLYAGLAPVAALWGAAWVWFGYRKYRR
jgi:hypothetical protein